MRRLAVFGAWFLMTTGVMAQGTVYLSNLVPGMPPVDAPVFDVDGTTPLAGPGFLAQLYAAPAGNSLAPLGVPVAFGVGGYFRSIPYIAVPGAIPGGTAVAQVRVWSAADGATFEQADRVGGHVGTSGILTVQHLGGGGGEPIPGAPLLGLKSFSLYEVVPEPSTLLLGLLGVAGFPLSKRRRA